jgi:hypothetical protein
MKRLPSKKIDKKIRLFFNNFSIEFAKITLVISVVLLLSWGITKATEDNFVEATNNFSVIGTVSVVSDDTVSLIDARGSGMQSEELYNLNIEHLTKVETKDYKPLIISDVKPGDTIIAQGVTDGSTFFITRIVSFSSTPLPPLQENATSTLEEITPPTEDAITSTEETEPASNTEPSSGTSSEEPVQEEVATSTLEEITPPTEQTATSTVFETMTNILEDGVDHVSGVLNTIIDTITESEESIPTPQPEPLPESLPVQ